MRHVQVRNLLGVIIGGTQVFLPFMVLSLTTSLQAIDRRLRESADILGAGPVRVFATITLPLSAPGLIAGSVLVFSMMLGAFVTPLILGGSAVKYLSVQVYTDALVLFNLPRATALSLILLDTFAGLLASHLLLVFPFMFRALLTSALSLRPPLLEASEILGASPATTLRRVVLPALVPGLVAGSIFSVIVSLDQFTVSLFVTQSEQVVLPVALYKYLFDVNDPVAAAVSTVLVIFGLLAALVIDRLGWLRHLAGSSA